MGGSSISLIVICIFIMPPILRGFYINFQYGLIAILGIFILDAVIVGYQPVRLGVNIFPPDVLFSVLLTIGLLRMMHKPWLFENKASILWLIFGATIGFSLLRGIGPFGTSAIVGFRENFYFWAACFYFLSFRITTENVNRFITLFGKAALALACLAILRWTSDAVGLTNYSYVGAGLPFRVLKSDEAFCISLGAFIFLIHFLSAPTEKKYLYVSLFCFACVLLLQHRSVWLSSFAAIFVVLKYSTRIQFPVFLKFLAIFAVFITITTSLLLLTDAGTKIKTSIYHSFASALNTEEGTQVDRVMGWKKLLTKWAGSDLTTLSLGYPYGTGYTRYTFGLLREFSPHNFYVQLLLRVGVIGFLCWLIPYCFCFLFLKKKMTNLTLEHYLLFIMLIGSVVYFIAYQGDYVHGTILGMAMSLKISSDKANNMGMTRIA